MNKQNSELSRAKIFSAIKAANPTVTMDVKTIEEEALDILKESEFARPKLLSEGCNAGLSPSN